MADVTISDLGSLTVTGGLLLPVSNGITTGKLTIGDINSLVTKTSLGLSNVENKSSATIRGEITSSNVTTALGYTPYNSTNPSGYITNTNDSVAKAWVSFDGLRNAAGTSILNNTNRFLRRTFNVSSVLRNGVGDYTVNFAPGTLSTAEYCAIATCDHQTSNSRFAGFSNTRSSSSLRVTIESTNGFGGSRVDSAYIGVVVFE